MKDKPIATEAQFRAAVKQYIELIGLHHPWVVHVEMTGKGEPADADERAAYAATSSDPNYYRAYLTFDPWHESWDSKEKSEIGITARHELFHVVLSLLTDWALTLCNGDADLEKMLHDKEEQVVTVLERMPIWEKTAPSS